MSTISTPITELCVYCLKFEDGRELICQSGSSTPSCLRELPRPDRSSLCTDSQRHERGSRTRASSRRVERRWARSDRRPGLHVSCPPMAGATTADAQAEAFAGHHQRDQGES
jgi:hypothetical protein